MKKFILFFIALAIMGALVICASAIFGTEGKKDVGELIPRVYVLDEEADSIFYRGKWYYSANNFFLIDWMAADGDEIKEHVADDGIWTISNSLIISDKGDTIACPGERIVLRYDEYGDTIFLKRKNIYF